MTAMLTITRGLPGSGKTTWANETLSAERSMGMVTVRVNRDDLRDEIFQRPVLTVGEETTVSAVQQDRVRAFLKAGVNVIVDDTNLHRRATRTWQKIARDTGASFAVKDFDVDVEECIERIRERVDVDGGRDVPAEAVRRMYKRYRLDKGFPPVPPMPVFEKYYVRDRRLPKAWVVDIDGTLTLGPHQRSPYDWARVGQDKPRYPVLWLVEALWESPEQFDIVLLSGRDESCRDETVAWLNEHSVPRTALYMRKAGDNRPDDIVKNEMFETLVAPDWNVAGIVDDRNSVVDMWRSKGLTCLQVAPGDF